jgi:putative cell wall-binding protein/spore germination protein YaaH
MVRKYHSPGVSGSVASGAVMTRSLDSTPQRGALRAAGRALRLAVVMSLLVASSALAGDEPLGGAVVLDDGSVLPPMPPDGLAPTVHAEMLADHVQEQATTGDGVPSIAGSAEPLAMLGTDSGAAQGPAGPLPNGLQNEVLGFLPFWKLDAGSRTSLRYDLVSTIAYFSIDVQANGALVKGASAGWAGWASTGMTEVVSAAHARGVRVVPTITMMAWDYNFSAMTTLLGSSANRSRLVGEVVSMVRDRRADGVNIDFEPVPVSLRSSFTALVREIKQGLVAAKVGSYVTVDTMAGAATWSTGYDVVGLTAPGAADAIVVMAYDFSYAASTRAGAVAPIDSPYIFDARTALRDHLRLVSPSKIIWGVPYYGRAWNTTSDALNATVRSPAHSAAFVYHGRDGSGTPLGARVLAERHGRRWDPVAQGPWFVFWDAGSNGWRQGYYDDPQSLRAKYDLVLANRLAGVGIWHLAMDTGVNDLWEVLAQRFAKVQRLGGADRYATAATVSAATFTTGGPVAYVATGANFPDALAAGPAATAAGGPVLLVTSSSVPASTAAELARLRPARIVVVGGTGAVSPQVATQLAGYATTGQVRRLAGADRYATAAAVSAATFASGTPVAYVATGANFPDALSGGVAAGRDGGPMLLVRPGEIPAATAAELRRLAPARIVIIGGTGAVSAGVADQLRGFATSGSVSRLSGADRYGTAVAVSAATSHASVPVVYVATGANFPDGLSGTPAAALAGGPLLVVPRGGLTAGLAEELRRLNPERVVLVGGPGAVSDTVAAQIQALWD